MSLIPMYGHAALLGKLRGAYQRGTLPGSLLFEGPRGVGKQRLALALARILVCEHAVIAPPSGASHLRSEFSLLPPYRAPCEACQNCKFSRELTHPDLLWFFPRPRLKDSDPSADDVRLDYAEAIAERVEAGGLYEAPSGTEGIYVAAVRTLVRAATMSPAMARRKVFVIGDAERMIQQEGADEAANTFLKILEEPPADTTVILTSSESGALLPTIRSRVVSVRVPRLADADVRAFLEDDRVRATLGSAAQTPQGELVKLAAGAPGRIVSRETWAAAVEQAQRLLDAATAKDQAPRWRAALGQGSSKARGSFSDVLDALTALLHSRTQRAACDGDQVRALNAARAVVAVENAKTLAEGNVNPQLVMASLLARIAPLVQ